MCKKRLFSSSEKNFFLSHQKSFFFEDKNYFFVIITLQGCVFFCSKKKMQEYKRVLWKSKIDAERINEKRMRYDQIEDF